MSASRYIAVNVLTGQQSAPFEFMTLAAFFIISQRASREWTIEQVSA